MTPASRVTDVGFRGAVGLTSGQRDLFHLGSMHQQMIRHFLRPCVWYMHQRLRRLDCTFTRVQVLAFLAVVVAA